MKELDNMAFSKYLENMEKSINIIDSIVPVLWQFDDKVYNVRFEKAIKAKLDELTDNRVNLSLEFSQSCFRLKLCFWKDRMVYTKREGRTDDIKYFPDGFDEIAIGYKYSNWCSEMWNYTEAHKKNVEEGFYTSGGDTTYYYIDSNNNWRIKSACIVKNVLETQKDLRAELLELREKQKDIEAIEDRFKKIKAEIDRFNEEVPFSIRKFYDIKSWVSQWY